MTPSSGGTSRAIADYDAMAARLRAVPGVTRAAPLVTGQVMANLRDRNAGVEVFGIAKADLMTIPRVAEPLASEGDIAASAPRRAGHRHRHGPGPRAGAGVGDRIRLISPNGVKTALGTSPRVAAYEIAYIFRTGRYQIDRTRVYLPFDAAQEFFNREGAADEIEVMVDDPERVEEMAPAFLAAAGDGMLLWSWKDASGDYLDALAIEDTVMFVLMAILVLIASLNIVSGLVMLVKNKGRDIGILRTMGLTEGSILRVFFICGALVGIIGTALGVVLGCLFAIYFDPILAFINDASGGGAWQPSIRGIYRLPAELRLRRCGQGGGLSLILAFVVTIFPGPPRGADEPGRGPAL